MPPQSIDDHAITTDHLFDGRIVVRQLRKGHRVGTDAVLLATEVSGPVAGTVVDVGAGVGAVGIAIAVRNPQVRLVLVEDDPATAALARENLVLNGLDERGAVARADIFDAAARRATGLTPGMASVVVTNPPFHAPARVRTSLDAGRRHAHVLAASGPEGRGASASPSVIDWLKVALGLLAPKGRFAMIHRPEALAAILQGLDGHAGAVRVTPVLPSHGRDATRILVRAVKGSRSPLTVAPPLVLHGDNGRFTPEAEARHRAP